MNQTTGNLRRTVGAVRKTIAASLLVLAFTVAGAVAPASATTSPCRVGAQSSHVETLQVSGQVAGAAHYGRVHRKVRHGRVIYVRKVTRYFYSGSQSRTVTSTVTSCSPDETESTAASPWAGATVVAVTTRQRVR